MSFEIPKLTEAESREFDELKDKIKFLDRQLYEAQQELIVFKKRFAKKHYRGKLVVGFMTFDPNKSNDLRPGDLVTFEVDAFTGDYVEVSGLLHKQSRVAHCELSEITDIQPLDDPT